MLTAAVASVDTKSGAYLTASLQQTGMVQSVVEWALPPNQLPETADAIPDVTLIELGRDPQIALDFASHLTRVRPSVCIIACSAQLHPTPDLLMQAMRSGVREFLQQPIDPLILRDTLSRLVKDRPSGELSADKLILVMGAKGGVGTSSMVVNLGVQIAHLTNKRVAVLDLARPLGHITLLLDLQSRFSLRDAVENLDRMDNHFFGGLLATHKSGLHVLAGAQHPDVWINTPVAALSRVLNVAQSSCDHVIADLGTHYSTEWAPILRSTRYLVLVAQTDVPSLWSLEKHLSALRSIGIEHDRFKIVINRWHRSDEEALEAFEKKVEHPIYARFPNDYRQVNEAVNLGTALSRNHNDPLVARYRKMAGDFAGIAPQKTEKRGAFTGLFSSSRK